jgi:tetratricopeptide (TPR) repeat protein
MTITRKTQIGLLITALVLFVLLFLAPKTHSEKKSEGKEMISSNENSTIISFLETAVLSLKPDEKTAYELLEKTAIQSKIDTAFVSVVHYWDEHKRPDLASYFVEKIADRVKTSDGYLKAGDRYYYSIRFVKNDPEIEALYHSAIRCYKKSIEGNPKNTEAKIQLAACYVEDGKDPMKGITLLKEIEKTDSSNVKLQLTFAFFSVKSGQIDKAIKRFNKVLEIDPLFIEAYLHLADAYEQQGDKNKTIEMLTKYANLTEDAMAKQEVLKYIEQLKSK